MVPALHQVEAHQSLLSRLDDARDQTDRLFDIVKREHLYERPIPERHRIVFYLGHLEAFDWNLLRERLPNVHPFNETFDRLFAFGIDPVGGGLPSDEPRDWPAIEEVARYNARIRELLDGRLSAENGVANDAEFPLEVLLNVAIEHRLMHAETLAYMFHQLPYEQKISPEADETMVAPAALSRMIEIPAGEATLGLDRATNEFGWDNEFALHRVDVPAFGIDTHKVTNGDFLRFISEGGYDNPVLWTEDNWNWITESDITHPAFWRNDEGEWHYRGMFREIPLPLDWPVYVSHAEAAAYARWAGKALPSEAQWHRAAYGALDGRERAYPWGDQWLDEGGNFDFRRWDPAPVGASPAGRSGFGAYGMVGNGWEWTASVFAPFPGFRAFPFYPGYSANFFDGRHYVLKGGSPRTAACMLRRSFRNWFQPHYPYVYASFRCVNG